MKMWQKITLSVMLAANIILMFMPWFGAMKGVQEISGIIVLKNPVTIISILAVLAGVWIKPIEKIRNYFIYSGFAGIIAVEVYEFFTWYTHTINPSIGFFKSFTFAFPEFYLGLVVTIAAFTTAVLFGYCQYKKEENEKNIPPFSF